MFLVVCLNPTLQKTLVIDDLREGEVSRSREYYLDAAGKGVNVARVLVQMGHRVVHLTHAGGKERRLFRELCAADGLEVMAPDSGSSIRTCYTLISRARLSTTEIVEEPEPVRPRVEARVRRAFGRLLHRAHTLVVSGSRAPGYSASLYADLVRDAKARGVRVILDIRGEDLRSALPGSIF